MGSFGQALFEIYFLGFVVGAILKMLSGVNDGE